MYEIYSKLRVWLGKGTYEANFFVYTSIIFGILFIFISAPMQAPDEPQHYWRAYQVSQLDLFTNKYGTRFGHDVPVQVKSLGEELSRAENPKSKLNVSLIRKSILKNNYNEVTPVFLKILPFTRRLPISPLH